MADTGWVICGTGAEDDSIGTFSWLNPSYITEDDIDKIAESYTFLSSGNTHYIKATNFGFSIPSGATIDGIEVRIKLEASSSDFWYDDIVKIVKSDGSIGSTNKGTDTALPISQTVWDYGGNSDLWGESWTYTDINDSDFGVVFSSYSNGSDAGYVYVNYIAIKVYYTGGETGTNTQINIGDDWKDISAMQINIGDDWKEVAGAQVNIGDDWKTIF